MASFSVKDIEESIERNDTLFGTRIADNTVNRIDIPGTYPYNLERHLAFYNGQPILDPANGTIIADDGTLTDSTAAASAFNDNTATFGLSPDPGETVEFRGREALRYVPNYEALWGAAAWFETAAEAGQRLLVEFTDNDRNNGMRYHFELNNARVEHLSTGPGGGADNVVQSVSQGDWADGPGFTKYDHDPFSQEGVDFTNPLNPRCTFGWYGALGSQFSLGYTRDSGLSYSPTLAYTSNTAGVSTEEINLNVKVIAEADSDSTAFTAQACSLGALIRGNAEQFDRKKPATFWDLGGNISQQFVDNDPVLAVRIDPDRAQVTAQIQEPVVRPDASQIIEVMIGAVREDHPDLTVNFDDPDNDGTNEGAAPRAQTRAREDALQWTRDATAYPTTSDIRSDGTEGLVPDLRLITSTVGEGGGNNRPGSTTAGVGQVKNTLFSDEVALYIPRTDPTSTETSGLIKYLKPLSEQDW